MKRLTVLMVVAVLATMTVEGQDLAGYKRIVKELSSSKYQGRGYAMDGANKAGEWLVKEFKRVGADEVVKQPFKLSINTFPGKMELKVDGKKQKPGVDFTMREFSPGVRGSFPLYYIDTANYDSEKIFKDLEKEEYKDCFVVCDFLFSYRHRGDFGRLQKKGECGNAGLLFTWEEPLKFYKAYGEKVVEKPIIWVPDRFPKDAKRIDVDIENRFLEDYECFNVVAKVEGRRHDSCYVFTAHYDHLGNLGKKVYYAGANDNASGTAAIVTLAAYYAKEKPEWDMYFIAFSGEDANLRGSEWYVGHPTVDLKEIKYLFNLDMIGDNNPVQYCEVSDEGLKGYEQMERLNEQNGYFKGLNRGKLGENSDHYPFAVKGVPCILFENEGGDAFKYYHTVYDTYERGEFGTYEPIFRIVRDFVESYGAQVEGSYRYQHGWEYDTKEGHIKVHEVGTMTFGKEGRAMDNAVQEYTMKLNEGGEVKWTFYYASPSKWRVEGDDFYFAGEEKTFKMEVKESTVKGCSEERGRELAQKIIESVRSSIGREIKFKMTKLTSKELRWSYTYGDGHTDTWEFYRNRRQ